MRGSGPIKLQTMNVMTAATITAGQFAVSWVLNSSFVTSVIAGPRTEAQWDDYILALDYRFTPEDEARYYRDVFVPGFRARNPGRIMPTLDEQRAEINRILTAQKVNTGMESFLDEAKRRVQIEILSEV